MKTCFKCLCAKPLDQFYRHAEMADGHLNKCKDCTKTDVKEHRQREWERVRAYDRMRASQPHRAVKSNERVARWRVEHPDRRRAQVILGNALRAGRIHSQPCWVCGTKAEAHHPDYSRPLDVVWLCPPHHKQTHALVANDSAMQRAA